MHEPAERQISWLQSLGRGIHDIGGIDPAVEAAILGIFGDGSFDEYRALTEAISEHYANANRGAYDLGQLAGTGLVAASAAWLPGLLAATNLGRMAVAGTTNGLFTGVDWATDADDWQTALERFFMGAALGGVTGKYTGLPMSYGTSTLAGFGHGDHKERDCYEHLVPRDALWGQDNRGAILVWFSDVGRDRGSDLRVFCLSTRRMQNLGEIPSLIALPSIIRTTSFSGSFSSIRSSRSA